MRTRNRILGSLPPGSLARFSDHLEAVTLPLRTTLVESNEPTSHVHFLEDGLASVVATSSAEHERVEVGHIGHEGMTGTHLVLDADRTPMHTFMQVTGHGYRLSAERLADAMAADRALHLHLLRYVQTYQLQLAYSALANARYTIPERLARWLLMCHDRLGDNGMPLTHEFLALMLGVRRSGVTNEIHVLEEVNAITATRALITVRDRAKLIEFAAGSYGAPEAEYARLMEGVATAV